MCHQQYANMDNLSKLIEEQDTYDRDSKEIISSFSFRSAEIEKIATMKSNPGWKVMEKKIREQVQIRILELVKDDPTVQTLLSLLVTADVKNLRKQLEEEIANLLPS
jgi:hypothetical protein